VGCPGGVLAATLLALLLFVEALEEGELENVLRVKITPRFIEDVVDVLHHVFLLLTHVKQ
jgi:hypothetical protein